MKFCQLYNLPTMFYRFGINPLRHCMKTFTATFNSYRQQCCTLIPRLAVNVGSDTKVVMGFCDKRHKKKIEANYQDRSIISLKICKVFVNLRRSHEAGDIKNPFTNIDTRIKNCNQDEIKNLANNSALFVQINEVKESKLITYCHTFSVTV